MHLAAGTVEAELKLEQTPQLFDDNFIFIRRNANSSQFVEHSPQLLQRLERCFYRSPWAALDLCDAQSVVSIPTAVAARAVPAQPEAS